MMSEWSLRQTSVNIELMSKTLRISPVLAQVLAHRGIRSKHEAIKFLNPDMKFLPAIQPYGMSAGVELVADTIANSGKIVVYGDYDADGVCSTVILYKALKTCGADVSFYIPHREEQGYGLAADAVEHLSNNGTDLLFCCDNGISAISEIAQAKNSGMRVFVLDHHEPSILDGEEVLPLADVIIDPKLKACAYPYKTLCAGGLAYKFARCLYEAFNKPFDDDGNEYLVFAMIATFCDVVDLNGENRILAKNGLDILNADKKLNLGLWRLIVNRGYELKDLNEYSIGFIIGPCINASGRLSHAALAVELFLTNDADEADVKALQLIELNEQRKVVTANAYERIISSLEDIQDNVLVLYDQGIHESVAGIVAGRIRERVNKPTIILCKSGNLVKGSGRSVEDYNMFEHLSLCHELFDKFGGHAMAAGFSLEEKNVPALRERLNANNPGPFVQTLRIDCRLPLASVTYTLARELRMLAPFGKENDAPLFGVQRVMPEQIRVIADKRTIIFTFAPEPNRRLKGVCFGMVDKFREALEQKYDKFTVDKIFAGVLRGSELTMDLAYAVEIDSYDGNQNVQIKIRDFKI